MTAKELLNLNGDIKNNSPLIETARRIHKILSMSNMPYTIIGGLAVVRNGAFRTTQDIDILINKSNWEKIKKILKQNNFKTEIDMAVDKKNGVNIDMLFAEDNWDMVISLPDPADVCEYDEVLGANFIGLFHLLQLKTAIYMQKRKEDGIEIASKDLSDVVELIKHNKEIFTKEYISAFHSSIVSVQLAHLEIPY